MNPMIKKTLGRLRTLAKPILLRAAGESASELKKFKQWGRPSFEGDGMRSYYKDVSWMQEPRFLEAYRVGFNTGHRFGDNFADLHLEWRLHIILWAAQQAIRQEGDFVECGVNTGIFSSAICKYFSFEKVSRKFYLFDTYEGIPETQMSSTERAQRLKDNKAFYPDCYEQVKATFSPWPNAQPVRGLVPDTLTSVPIEKVAYLSIDMNIAKPERDALEFFWPKMSSGGMVIFDDYGWINHGEQKAALDDYAKSQNVSICCLPTGQGLMVKP